VSFASFLPLSSVFDAQRSCKRWYRACATAAYTISHDRLAPCTGSDVVCANLTAIVANGNEFCRLHDLPMAKGVAAKDFCFRCAGADQDGCNQSWQ
jgi:hypothetical protein